MGSAASAGPLWSCGSRRTYVGRKLSERVRQRTPVDCGPGIDVLCEADSARKQSDDDRLSCSVEHHPDDRGSIYLHVVHDASHSSVLPFLDACAICGDAFRRSERCHAIGIHLGIAREILLISLGCLREELQVVEVRIDLLQCRDFIMYPLLDRWWRVCRPFL